MNRYEKYMERLRIEKEAADIVRREQQTVVQAKYADLERSNAMEMRSAFYPQNYNYAWAYDLPLSLQNR